ncbi:hypothetical protein LY625_00495 [Lysobacter sp. GX 14042]|uniref:hypothetical protein n=1 Tax=Lysobacter sp. GX 14042 TaxID=2907155 RepID=UPI001F2B4043|nr:hypothetical protein [Lysobacter sp. GX 14042]MCE7031120.1 hypothetical protein [Lysobacter sp. GX 14042]
MNCRYPGVVALAMAVSIAGCSVAPVQEPAAPVPAYDPVAMVAAIRAAGNEGKELVVTPLGDAAVTDLRAQAGRQLQAGEVQAAADSLDQALSVTPDDPALLQERAELAVLLRDLDAAAALARRAIGAGSGVGPYCRQHWETLHQVALAHAHADPALAGVAADAGRQRDACTVGPPPRY